MSYSEELPKNRAQTKSLGSAQKARRSDFFSLVYQILVVIGASVFLGFCLWGAFMGAR